MRSFVKLAGQPLSRRARLIAFCKTTSGVDIIPPQRVTRASCNVPDQLEIQDEERAIIEMQTVEFPLNCFQSYRKISSFSTCSQTHDVVELFKRIVRMNS